MKTAKRNTFSVLFFIKKSKLLKNGDAPICMRITCNGQNTEIMIKRGVKLSLWNIAKECSRGTDRSSLELNHYVETMRAKVYKIHRTLEADGKEISVVAIRDILNGRDNLSRTLVEIYTEHNEKCRALIGKDYAIATVEKFDTSLSHIKDFLSEKYHIIDIPLHELSPKFISDFDFWLKTVHNCRQNSALKHLINLKKIIRIAIANQWIKHDPFVTIKFKHEQTHMEFLTQDELTRVMNKKFSMTRLEQVRDVFVFCSFTGLAFIDVQQLSAQHLVKDNNGSVWIRKQRQKTGNMCNIPLLSPAIKLLEKYIDNEECKRKNVLLPVSSNQKMNAYLKEIADLCEINKKLSTHVARYTYATVVCLANGVSMENVAKMLGHSNTKMTAHYAKVLDSTIMRDMAKIEDIFAVS